VAPPSDKINNSIFHLQNQARSLHSNVHVFKIPAPICTIFGTFPLLHFHQLSNTKWCHLTKDKTCYSVIINSLKVTMLNLSCFLAQSKCYKKSTSWTSLYHLKICLICPLFLCKMHSRYDVTICWCFTRSRPWEFLSDQIANKYNACCCSSRSWWPLSSCLSIHCCSRFCSAIRPD